MATAKAKTAKKSTEKKTGKSAATKPAAKSAAGSITTVNDNSVKSFFGRKYDASENILTIFKSPRIIGAILGEVIGTMLLTMVLLTLGLYNPLYLIFGIMAITIGVFALSGANLNPAITVGMMATRRMSPIRGTLYIIAQVLGAWFGMLIVNAFHLAGGEGAAALPQIAAADASMFWPIVMVEFIGAIIIGFFFARALIYKRSAFTFGAVVAGGIFVAILLAIVLTSNYLMLQDAFVLNPAVAIMYQVLPSEAADFGTLIAEIGKALTTFVVFPMIGATIGFFLSDIATKTTGEKLA
jgi:glycerol uptake facilitator-like aquaporin